MTTYYDILGVRPTASATEIKAAYRRLVKKFHPDRNLGANTAVRHYLEDNFRNVQEAYDTLGDKGQRAEYDSMLAQLNSGEYYEPTAAPPPPPSPSPPPTKRHYCPSCRKAVSVSAPTTVTFCPLCGANLQGSQHHPKDKQVSKPKQKTPDSVGVTLIAAFCGLSMSLTLLPLVFVDWFPTHTELPWGLTWFFFFAATPCVLWICIAKLKMEWPIPALIPALLLVCSAILANRQVTTPRASPSSAASGARPHTIGAARAEAQSATRFTSDQQWRDGKLHSDLGWELEQRGDFRNASTEYDAAMRLNPNDSFSRAGLNRINGEMAVQPPAS